jgi:para-nitrobenzyl esterase
MRRVVGRIARPWCAALGVVFLASTVLSIRSGASFASARQPSCLIQLDEGAVQGVDAGPSCTFLGIPYAASTAGNNRWRAPLPAAPWMPAVLQANTPPPTCAGYSAALAPQGSEDCLKLNVWVPDPLPADAPVLVWIHTGSFMSASANFASTNGRKLAEETGVIVVAPNYRLGPFGFLSHAALAAEDPQGSSGNYGLLDQQAALRWVRDNIARFGGDPSNVTLAGTSAGGQSTGLHLVIPGSDGLFHRAIIQSAYPTTRWFSAEEAQHQGAALAAALGCTNPQSAAACLRSQSQSAVLTALPVAASQVAEPPGRVFWEPVVDGDVIPDQPRVLFESGAFLHVPTIVGFNRDEGWGNFATRSFPAGVSLQNYNTWVMTEFGAHGADVLARYPAAAFPSPAEAMARVVGDVQFACEARRLVRSIERSRTPVFLYSYEYEIDDLSLDHVIHGVETNILFNNPYVAPQFANHPLDAPDLALHAQMAGYWVRFATTGDPNTDDESVVRWPAFKHPSGNGRGADKYLVLDSVIREGMRPREAACDFFEPFFFRAVLVGVPASQ